MSIILREMKSATTALEVSEFLKVSSESNLSNVARWINSKKRLKSIILIIVGAMVLILITRPLFDLLVTAFPILTRLFEH